MVPFQPVSSLAVGSLSESMNELGWLVVTPFDRSGRCALQAVVAEGEEEVEAEQPAAEAGSGFGRFRGMIRRDTAWVHFVRTHSMHRFVLRRFTAGSTSETAKKMGLAGTLFLCFLRQQCDFVSKPVSCFCFSRGPNAVS